MHESCTSNVHPCFVDMVATVFGRRNGGSDALAVAQLPSLAATAVIPARGISQRFFGGVARLPST